MSKSETSQQQKPTTYTPGPWFTKDERDLNEAIWIESEHPEVGRVSLAEVRPGSTEAAELGDIEANARLIAAAPETATERDRLKAINDYLLAALEQIAYSDLSADMRSKARAALAKAGAA